MDETGEISIYCWNCIYLLEDEKHFAYCEYYPNTPRTWMHHLSTITKNAGAGERPSKSQEQEPDLRRGGGEMTKKYKLYNKNRRR